MISNELHYLKYIVGDIFGQCCSEIVELILLYGNKLTINEIINLSNYEFSIVRNILLCLLIHNIVDIRIIYDKSHECSHAPSDGKTVPLLPDERGERRARAPVEETIKVVQELGATAPIEVVKGDQAGEAIDAAEEEEGGPPQNGPPTGYADDEEEDNEGDDTEEDDALAERRSKRNLREEMHFLTYHGSYKYMKGCSCASCICKIRRVEYWVVVNNIYSLVRYSSIFYYMHQTRVKSGSTDDLPEYSPFCGTSPAVDSIPTAAAGKNKGKNVTTPNDALLPSAGMHSIMSYNFFTSDRIHDYSSSTLQEEEDNNAEEVSSKRDIIHFIEKVILLRVIKNGRITIDACVKNLEQDDYVEVCKKEIPNIKKKKLKLIFLQLLKRKYIKKCKYFNEHACENDTTDKDLTRKYDQSINYINGSVDPAPYADNYDAVYHPNGSNHVGTNKVEANVQKTNPASYGKAKTRTDHTVHPNHEEINRTSSLLNPTELDRNNQHSKESLNGSNDSFLFAPADNVNSMNGYNPATNAFQNDSKKHGAKITRGVLSLVDNAKRRKTTENESGGNHNCRNFTNNDTFDGNIFSIIGERDRTSDPLGSSSHLNEDNNSVISSAYPGGTSYPGSSSYLRGEGSHYPGSDTPFDRSNMMNVQETDRKNHTEISSENQYEYFNPNKNTSDRDTNKDNMQSDLLDYLDNRFTYFQANNEVLTILYLKQECFNFITHYYNFNEVEKGIFFFLLKNVQLSYSVEENNYKYTPSFCTFENVQKYVITNFKKKNIYMDRNVVLENLNNLIKYPDELVRTECNEMITYAADFSNIKNIYKKKITTNIIENMNGSGALRIWNFLISTPEQKVNDEVISENVLIPLNDVRKKLYNLLYHGYIKCHECNNSNVNKTYIKHSLSFSTNVYYTSNKIKENLFTIAKNIYIRKLHENNEINTLHNKSNICANEVGKDPPPELRTGQGTPSGQNVFTNQSSNKASRSHQNKKEISLTSREYAVDYLEISLINLDKLIFIFNS
ncbi:hypothetical protein C922_02452 [Plasmodium inui San Antonio 1]|uniref:DNA-directed RNA polymerase III subunit RPC3 n=1 Tax=Plasmodium inui San Antonio 1 TaxID=1237626 RepID=W7A254_9APIC|nr:hypothetical protein C922_02452 [Plasmodium inui San Antonio 1]EUD67302.1 hypothetical protein C922_02452 [Plasmodium inui San Antonio 1]